MQPTNKGRTTISIVGITLGALLTLGLVTAGISRLEVGPESGGRSSHTVATMHHPTDRGPGYSANFSDAGSAPSSKLGFDRDVATNYLARRAWATAVADAGTNQHAPTQDSGATTTPEVGDRADQVEGFRER